jgi:hypothetical protein
MAASLTAGVGAHAAAPTDVVLAQWNGDDEQHREHEGGDHVEQHREHEEADRWERFYRWRMHWHVEHEGPRWEELPASRKQEIVHHEWREMHDSWRG